MLSSVMRRAMLPSSRLAAASSLRTLAPVARSLHASGVRHAEAEAAAGAGGLEFTFTVPSHSLYESANVEMVILPGGDGMYGVMPNHVPTVAELKPGVVYVQETAGADLTKYCVSGGFATGERTHSHAQCVWARAVAASLAARGS